MTVKPEDKFNSKDAAFNAWMAASDAYDRVDIDPRSTPKQEKDAKAALRDARTRRNRSWHDRHETNDLKTLRGNLVVATEKLNKAVEQLKAPTSLLETLNELSEKFADFDNEGLGEEARDDGDD